MVPGRYEEVPPCPVPLPNLPLMPLMDLREDYVPHGEQFLTDPRVVYAPPR